MKNRDLGLEPLNKKAILITKANGFNDFIVCAKIEGQQNVSGARKLKGNKLKAR